MEMEDGDGDGDERWKMEDGKTEALQLKLFPNEAGKNSVIGSIIREGEVCTGSLLRPAAPLMGKRS